MKREQVGKYLKRGYWSSYSDNIFIKHYSIALNYLYDRIRYFLPERIRIRVIGHQHYDINADYVCCYCSHPVLRNFLYCSIKCADMDDIFYAACKELKMHD